MARDASRTAVYSKSLFNNMPQQVSTPSRKAWEDNLASERKHERAGSGRRLSDLRPTLERPFQCPHAPMRTVYPTHSGFEVGSAGTGSDRHLPLGARHRCRAYKSMMRRLAPPTPRASDRSCGSPWAGRAVADPSLLIPRFPGDGRIVREAAQGFAACCSCPPREAFASPPSRRAELVSNSRKQARPPSARGTRELP